MSNLVNTLRNMWTQPVTPSTFSPKIDQLVKNSTNPMTPVNNAVNATQKVVNSASGYNPWAAIQNLSGQGQNAFGTVKQQNVVPTNPNVGPGGDPLGANAAANTTPTPNTTNGQQNYDPMVPTVTPSNTTPLANNGVWQNTPTGMQQAATGNIMDALTGKMYDPFAEGAAEAEARAEANKRSSVAQQLASAGLTGTGLGAQVGMGTEGDILKNRFASNIGIEQARNESRMNAVPTAINYGTTQNAAIQQNIDNTQKNRDVATTKMAEIALSRPDWAANPNLALGDQNFMSYAQQEWEASGNTGKVTPEFAYNQAKAITDPRNTNAVLKSNFQIDQMVTGGALTPDQGQALKAISSPYSIALISKFIKKDDKGNYSLDTTGLAAAFGDTSAQSSLADPTTAEAYNPDTSDPLSDSAIATVSGGPNTPNYSSALQGIASSVENGGWDDFVNLKNKSPAAYQAVLKKINADNPQMTFTPHRNGATLQNAPPNGSIIKLKGEDGNYHFYGVVSTDGVNIQVKDENGETLWANPTDTSSDNWIYGVQKDKTSITQKNKKPVNPYDSIKN